MDLSAASGFPATATEPSELKRRPPRKAPLEQLRGRGRGMVIHEGVQFCQGGAEAPLELRRIHINEVERPTLTAPSVVVSMM